MTRYIQAVNPNEDINKIRGRGARTPREFTTVAEHLKNKKKEFLII